LRYPLTAFACVFTNIGGVHEYPDTSLLLSDTGDESLWLLRPNNHEPVPVGRRGPGPNEFVLPGRVLSNAGDSAVVVDLGVQALIIVPRQSTVIRKVTLTPFLRTFGIRALGAQGELFVETRTNLPLITSATAGRDSVYVERWDLKAGHRDIVTAIYSPTGQVGYLNGVILTQASAEPFSTHDQWSVLPDNSVLIFHTQPYRVEVVRANGAREERPVGKIETIRLTEEHKNWWLRTREMALQRFPALRGVDLGHPVWPSYLPPFLPDAIIRDREGMTWVRRTTSDLDSSFYDVFGRDGRLAGKVEVEKRSKVVGFGARSVYLATTSREDLQCLRRFAMDSWQ
jgi:hypothetical protein